MNDENFNGSDKQHNTTLWQVQRKGLNKGKRSAERFLGVELSPQLEGASFLSLLQAL